MTISVAPASAQTMDANGVLASIDQKAAAYRDVALEIWSFAELGYQETKSSALLPGLSQSADPVRKAIVADGAGHGCGYHLFGTAATASAIALKEWLIANKRSGTLRFYGTPAERLFAEGIRKSLEGELPPIDRK